MKKLNTSELLDLSCAALSDLVSKSPKFIINDKEMEVDVLVKSLSYDELTHIFSASQPSNI